MMKPVYDILLNGDNFSAEFNNSIMSVVYNFKQSAQADDISISIADTDSRFINDLYPKKGDTVELDIGWNSPRKVLACGEFEIDSPEFDLHNKTVTLQGASTALKKSLREKRYRKYKDTNLKAILQSRADENGLNLKGNIADISIKSKTQKNTDLEFITELADLFGYVFKIDGDDLIFTAYEDLDGADPSHEIDLNDLLEGSMITDSKRVYQYCEITCFRKGAKYSKTVEDPSVDNGQYLRIEKRCENLAQAELMAKAELYRANRDSISGTLTFPLTIEVAAGSVIRLNKAGELAGLYCAKSGSHSIQGKEDPALTSVEVYRV